ncbi:hypothetical protein EVAR_62119_1 [Eumeta japonica]|uniref:Uncharacterized protein n=1 Tax=Eumeta variegata TaxID=151549 RepID=A0A4C1Z718_EUMVA|nr:hypothetical protein EVAR_62119_1 [Eumeta japonica]
MKIFHSELPANDILRRYYAVPLFLLLRRIPTIRHCDAFVTNFTAAKFRELHCMIGVSPPRLLLVRLLRCRLDSLPGSVSFAKRVSHKYKKNTSNTYG